MKRVLIVASDFAPSSLPSALRARFFAQHLSDYGWQPTVLTVDPAYYEGLTDPENERLIPKSVEVLRTRALPAKLTRRLGFGDLTIRSLVPQWRAISTICERKPPDVLFVSVPPYFQIVLGRMAHRRFGVPYVVDYIDPWVSDEWRQLRRSQRLPRRRLAHVISTLIEPWALRDASHITAVSHGMIDHVVSRYPWLDSTPTTEIPYGGSVPDFEYLRAHPRRQTVFDPADGYVHVSYVGVVIPQMERTLRAMLLAVRQGLETAPELFRRLRLHFVGTTYHGNAAGKCKVLPLAAELGVEHMITEVPTRVPYLDSLQILIDSAAVMAIGSDAPYYTASKIFPCILSARPILAVFHEASSVVDIVRRTRSGSVVTFSESLPPEFSLEEITTAFRVILQQPQGYKQPTVWSEFDQFGTAAMTERLAHAFDHVVKHHEQSRFRDAGERAIA